MPRLILLLPLAWALLVTSEATATRDELLRVMDEIPSSDTLQLTTHVPDQDSKRVEIGRRISHEVTTRDAAYVTLLRRMAQSLRACLAAAS